MTDSVPCLGHPEGYTPFSSPKCGNALLLRHARFVDLVFGQILLKGDAEASLIYGAYTALIYAAPVLGGRMADIPRLSFCHPGCHPHGHRRIHPGCNGHFRWKRGLHVARNGRPDRRNGYFKANISTIVGKLYADGDPRQDSGFTIFYIGINIGALMATTIVAFVGETYGFEYGFGWPASVCWRDC